jgi:ferrous iron transport protein B
MKVFVVGNPNVGKSLLFNRITGMRVISSNYPGTSVEFTEGSREIRGRAVDFYDLPGTYSLTCASEDERIGLEMLTRDRPDKVIVVANATSPAQSLVLCLTLIELGYQVILALNFMDLATKRFKIDLDGLRRTLGVPVIPVVARTGIGVEALVEAVVAPELVLVPEEGNYDAEVMNAISSVATEIEPLGLWLNARGLSIKALEGNPYFQELLPIDVLKKVDSIRMGIEGKEPLDQRIARERHEAALRIESSNFEPIPRQESLSERVSRFTLQPISGALILGLVLISLFLVIIFVGGFIEVTLLNGYNSIFGHAFLDLANLIGGSAGQAVSNAINLSIQAILAIVVPYVIPFFVILGTMEDSGYMPRVAVLVDGAMSKLGINGKAIIPMIVGMGCSVPSIMGTRIMESKAERLALAILIVIAIPCSAQTIIIIGTVGLYSGIGSALLIYAFLFCLLIIVALVLKRFMKVRPTAMAMEMPEITVPSPRNVLIKTYLRSKDFVVIAFPILLAGSLVLEFLMVYGVLNSLVEPLAPFTMGFLGLPVVTIIAFIFGVIRKEMTIQMLFVLFGTTNLALFMTSDQFLTFAMIMATYVPCLAVSAAIRKEFGIKYAFLIFAGSITFAFLLGGMVHFLLLSF